MPTRTEKIIGRSLRSGAGVLALCAGCGIGWPAPAATNMPTPALHLSFENGLMPDIGPTNELAWTAQEAPLPPPQYDEDGLTGRALRITTNKYCFGVRLPQQERKRGTLLLWRKEPQGIGAGGMVNSWGPGWSGWHRGRLQTDVLLGGVDSSTPADTNATWTQYGISWQNEGPGRICFYTNGKRVTDTPGLYSSESILIGINTLAEGKSVLYDDICLWDRVLTDAEIKRVYRQDSRCLNQPIVSVHKLVKPPSVDGKILPEEWSSAAVIAGLLDARNGDLAPDPSVFYLGYDATHLYVAMKGEMTALARDNPALVYEKFLKSEGAGRDAKVAQDDAVELILSPDYWKSGDHRAPGPWKEYRLLANAAGAVSPAAYAAGGADASWSPEWQSASSVSAKGWQFEARIPWAAFGSAMPAPGDQWGLQLGRIWKQLKDAHDVWAWGRRLSDDTVRRTHAQQATGEPLSSMGTLRFADTREPLVRVDNLGRLSDRMLDFQATLLNPAAEAQAVDVKLFTDTASCAYAERLALPAGQEMRFARQGQLTDFAASRLTFEASDTNGAVIHRTEVQFAIEQKFGVRVVQFPNYEKFRLELDLGALSEAPVNELLIDVSLHDAAGEVVYR
ncbi:MAG: hypothetical protein PHR35_20690, partial [Kiritimatiellae bacterium]|nr:hypothetical protein [Kiritimatiellia bacterium]